MDFDFKRFLFNESDAQELQGLLQNDLPIQHIMGLLNDWLMDKNVDEINPHIQKIEQAVARQFKMIQPDLDRQAFESLKTDLMKQLTRLGEDVRIYVWRIIGRYIKHLMADQLVLRGKNPMWGFEGQMGVVNKVASMLKDKDTPIKELSMMATYNGISASLENMLYYIYNVCSAFDK